MSSINGVKVHPVADQFPMMDEESLNAMANDIARNGLQKPIELLPDGRLIDGRNRLRACKIAGVEPFFVTLDPENVAAHVFSANKYRRHLTSGQLAALAAEEEEAEKEAALERKREGGRKGGEIAGRGRDRDVQQVAQPFPDEGRAVEKLAKKFGTNKRYVQDAVRIKKEAPEVFDKLKRGDLEMTEARIATAEITGTRAAMLANSAKKKARHNAEQWIGIIGCIPDYCENVNTDTVRGDESLCRQWLEKCDRASRALRAVIKRLEK